MDQWLVRTAQNVIAGPFTQAQIVELVGDKQLGPEDEVCQANKYWFFLHEEEEVRAQLGISAPARDNPVDDEEVTETETDTIQTIDAQPLPDDELPELAEIDLSDGRTSVMTRRAPVARKVPVAGSVSVRGVTQSAAPLLRPFEKSSYWRVLAWFLIIGIFGTIVAVLRLTAHP